MDRRAISVANLPFCGTAIAAGNQDPRAVVTLALSGILLCAGLVIGAPIAGRLARKEKRRRR